MEYFATVALILTSQIYYFLNETTTHWVIEQAHLTTVAVST